MAAARFAIPPPVRPYAEEVGSDPGTLRIGYVERQPGGEPLHPECEAAVRAALRRLADLGHRVEAESPAPLRAGALAPHVLTVMASSVARDLDRFAELLGRAIGPDDLDADTWRVAEIGRSVTATRLLAAVDAYHDFRREMLTWWENGFDLLVTPTLTRPPPRVGEIVPSADAPLDAFIRSGALLPFCVPFNVTGQPAVSLPLHVSADGLPVGVQLVADARREDVLIRVAAQLEADVRWWERRPRVHA